MPWRGNIHGWVRSALVVVLLAYALAGYLVQAELRERIMLIEKRVAQEQAMPQVLTTSWTSGGDTITVETPRLPDETTAAWAERHRVAVSAMKAEFPPDPE